MTGKSLIVAELHAMVHARLFGDRPWLAEKEECRAIDRKLDDLGLQESASVSENARRDTQLGVELELKLMMVFLGIFDELEVPMILEEHGLIDASEVDRLYDGPDLSEHGERILRPIVQTAFLDHYNPSGRLA